MEKNNTLKNQCEHNGVYRKEKVDAFINATICNLKKEGVSEEELHWYRCFLESAVPYIKETCPDSDFTFEGLLKACKVTEFWKDSYMSIYENMLRLSIPEKSWTRIDQIIRFHNAQVEQRPDNPAEMLKKVLEAL